MPLSFNNIKIAFEHLDDAELKRAHFLFNTMNSPTLTKVGIGLAKWALKWHLPVKGIIRSTLFKQFVGGETLEEVGQKAKELVGFQINLALDYGVERKQVEADFDKAVPEFIKAVRYAATQPNIPFVPVKVTGFAHFEMMAKMDEGKPLTAIETEAWKRVKVRIDQICAAAAQADIMILIDAEETWVQKTTDDLVEELMEQYNQEKPIVFNTYQLYRHDRLEAIKSAHQSALSKGYVLGVKLVRGAYMDKERERAEEMGYPSPIQPDKESTDHDFDAAVIYCLEQIDKLGLFIGTHNEKSCIQAADFMNDNNIRYNHPHVWFAQLYGMSDNITFNMANHGFNVAKYIPYGPLKDVIPYLLRRAEENTSVADLPSRELSLIRKEMKRRGLNRL